MILALALMTVAPLAAPAPPPAKRAAMKPDFSAVTSRAAAEALARQGKLVRILLFPAEFGGEDVPENAVYITPEAAAARELILGTLQRFAKEGLIDKLDVTPDYKGDSFVPSRIVMHATHSKKKGSFEPTIEVW
ncbi:hypothetical protein PX554_01610 [Sphingomonas sp. H39-1-10]|uniref:hypothetical protein n=1 Tax=Sphingomonas TaxID=13687 RepID=UPI000887448E|nr:MULTISPECIES: hypothetical protein [Sphingomonas]MDF0486811.1 hypothetical protein [Sphingomonas pollutisoli]SDA35103.1 hypothetical protein SAMN03159340_03170 [Sphingomonas sp. NFR15]